MPANHLSCGIEFRKNQLILCLLQKTWRGIKLLEYRVKSWADEIESEAQLSFINNFISQYPVTKDKIFLALPREKVAIRFIRLPLVARENLRQVLEYEAPKYVPMEREEIIFAYKILRQDGQGLDLVVIFAQKKVVDYYLSLLGKIGLQPQAIQVASLGALNLYFYHRGQNYKKNVVLIDLQESFAEINLLKDGEWKENFHFPLAVENIGEKIIQTCQWGGISADLLEETTFFIFGPGAEAKLISSLQNHPALRRITPPPQERMKVVQEDLLPSAMYTAAGLALAGLIKTRFNLNLIPAETKRKVRQVGKFFFVFFLFSTLFLTFSWIWGSYEKVQNELQILRTEINKKKPEVEAVEKLKKEREDFLKEIGEFEKISSAGVRRVEILKELTQILPPPVWIWNLKIMGNEVEISGFAESAADLLPLLDRSPLFEKVEFLAPVTKERDRRLGGEKEKERFKIRMHLEKKRF